MLKTSLSIPALKEYTKKQLTNFFPDGGVELDGADVDLSMHEALQRLEYSFSHVRVNYYWDDHQPYFYHLNSDQYAQYLWFLANSLWKRTDDRDLCSKLILLNKALHGFWISYKCPMPDIFYYNHPVGSVIGNTFYSDFMVVMQNVTIQTSNREGQTPLIVGKGCVFASGSKVIGGGYIGDRCTLGVDSLLYNPHMEHDSVAEISTGTTVVRKRRSDRPFAERYFFSVE